MCKNTYDYFVNDTFLAIDAHFFTRYDYWLYTYEKKRTMLTFETKKSDE